MSDRQPGKSFERQTIASTVTLSGLALHSGRPVVMTIHPYDDGIAFRYGATAIKATPDNVTSTERSTKLGEISTVEHVMSALAGLEVSDALVELDYPEAPGLDGSSLPIVEAILAAGLKPLGSGVAYPPFIRVFMKEDALSLAASEGDGHWRFEYEASDRWPRKQTYETIDVIGHYRDQIAPARTIALEEEVETVRKMGLGLGLDETSALVLGHDGYVNEARFIDEPARHKLLDLIGDVALAGIPIRFLNLVAYRSGHRANVELARRLVHASEALAHAVVNHHNEEEGS